MHSLALFFQKTWLVYALAVVAAVAVLAPLALLKTPEYSAEVDILVVQAYTINDPFTATKSAEAVRDNLADVIHTTVFFNQVAESGLVDLSALETLNEEDRRKAWEKTVETQSSTNSPTLTILGYDPNPGQAEALANAVAQTLVKHGGEYHSSPDTITLRVVDATIVSSSPTRPNLLKYGILAACGGALLGAVILFLRSDAPLRFVQNSRTKRQTPESSFGPVVDVSAEPVKRTPAEVLPPPEYNVLDVTNFHHSLPKKEDLPFHPSQAKGGQAFGHRVDEQ